MTGASALDILVKSHGAYVAGGANVLKGYSHDLVLQIVELDSYLHDPGLNEAECGNRLTTWGYSFQEASEVVVAQRAGDQCQIVDEIVLPNSNTQEMVQEINRRYPGREGAVHPDPSAMARKTSAPAGETDLTIIERAGWPVYRTQAPYKMVDRINSVNAMPCNAQEHAGC